MSMNPRVVPILLLTFVNALGGTLLIPVLPFVVRDLGYSDFVFALLIAAYPAAQFFAAPILGSLADHRGRKPILVLSQAGTLGSWVLFALSWFVGGGGALALIAASRVIDGLTGGNASVAAAYLADVTTDDERTQIFAMQGAIAGAALIVGPALGAFTAATSLGYLGPALLAIAISALTLAGLMFRLDESLDPEHRVGELDVNPLHQLNLVAKARHLIGAETIMRLLSVQALFTLAFSGYTTIVVLWYVDRLGVSETTAGLLLLAIGVFLIVNELVTVRIANKLLGDVGTLRLGLLLAAAGFIGVRFPSSVLVFLPISFVLNAGMAMVLPTLQSLVTRVADEREEGQVQGINTSVAAAASTVAPVVAGALYAGVGGAATLYVVAAVTVVAVLVVTASSAKLERAIGDGDHQPSLHGPVHSLARRAGGGARHWGLRHGADELRHHGIRCQQGRAPRPIDA